MLERERRSGRRAFAVAILALKDGAHSLKISDNIKHPTSSGPLEDLWRDWTLLIRLGQLGHARNNPLS